MPPQLLTNFNSHVYTHTSKDPSRFGCFDRWTTTHRYHWPAIPVWTLTLKVTQPPHVWRSEPRDSQTLWSPVSEARFDWAHHPAVLLETSSLFSWPETQAGVGPSGRSRYCMYMGAPRLLSSVSDCSGGQRGCTTLFQRTSVLISGDEMETGSGDGNTAGPMGFSPGPGLWQQ